MAAIMVAENRKPWAKQRRHRQRHFWAHGEEGRISHLLACAQCADWRIKKRPTRGRNF